MRHHPDFSPADAYLPEQRGLGQCGTCLREVITADADDDETCADCIEQDQRDMDATYRSLRVGRA